MKKRSRGELLRRAKKKRIGRVKRRSRVGTRHPRLDSRRATHRRPHAQAASRHFVRIGCTADSRLGRAERGETQPWSSTLGTVSDEQRVEGWRTNTAEVMLLTTSRRSASGCRPIRPGRRGSATACSRQLAGTSAPPTDSLHHSPRLQTGVERLIVDGRCAAGRVTMDAGVPIANPVAGISIGLVKEPGVSCCSPTSWR